MVLGNESRADQRKSMMFHDSLYSFLHTAGVSAHAPGKEPGGPQKYYISVTSSSKHVHEKFLTSHLSYCNTTRLRKPGCQQYISSWGEVTPPTYISAHPAPTDPLQFPSPSFVFHCIAFCFYTYG